MPASQTQAITANLSSLPQLEQLGQSVTSFNQGQISKMLESIIPGWSNMTKTASSTINSLMKGQIPTDVSQAVQASAAAKALTGGFGGSGLAGNLTARDLGLTSLQLTQSGLSSAESWTSLMNQLYSPSQFNVASMFITPQQQFQDTMANQEAQWQQNWLQNQIDSAHSWNNVLGASLINTDQQLASIASSLGGSLMGGA